MKNKSLAFSDYNISNDFDIITVTETWLGGPGDKACIAELVPSGYKIAHVPRQGLGGGVAVIYKALLKLTMLASSRNTNVTSFEYMDCNITVKKLFSTISCGI